MVGVILFFLVILIVFIISTEAVTVKFMLDERFKIEIDFILTGIVLYPDTSTLKKLFKKSKFKPSAEAIVSASSYFLSKTDINVAKLILPITNRDFAKGALQYITYNTFISTIFNFISEFSKTFVAHTIIITHSANNNLKPTADIRLKFKLLYVFAAAFVFLKEQLKNNKKVKKRYVRNKNE